MKSLLIILCLLLLGVDCSLIFPMTVSASTPRQSRVAFGLVSTLAPTNFMVNFTADPCATNATVTAIDTNDGTTATGTAVIMSK